MYFKNFDDIREFARKRWEDQNRANTLPYPEVRTVNAQLAQWWCRGVTGAIDKIVSGKKYGPAAKQLLLDVKEELETLIQQKPIELDEHQHDMFILQGLLLLVRHLRKQNVCNPQMLTELKRLVSIISDQG